MGDHDPSRTVGTLTSPLPLGLNEKSLTLGDCPRTAPTDAVW